MKDGKRFVSWIGQRVQSYQEKRKAQGFIRREELKQIHEAREEARFKGELVGAKEAGYREGMRKAQQPSGFARFAGALSETFQVDSSFYGVGSRSPHKRKSKHRGSKKRGKRKGRTIVIKL